MEIAEKLQPYLDNIASFLKKSKRHSVGVDIGSDSIKIVELEKTKGKIKLKNYALVKIKSEMTRQEIRKFSGQMVKNILNQMSSNSNDVNMAIPSYSSLITLMEVFGQTEEEIRREIEREVGKYIPVDLKEVVYDWNILDLEKGPDDLEGEKNKQIEKKSNNKGKFKEEDKITGLRKVLLVSVMKNISNEYEISFQKSNLKIGLIEVDCFSIQRALFRNSRDNYLVIDIGGKVTNFIGICQGKLLFNRNIDLAGEKLTDLISRGFNVNRKRAESMKINQGLKTESKEILKNVLEPFCDSIIDQVDKRLKEFDEFKKENLDKIVLTGGGSEIIGLKEYFEDKLEVDVVYGNPWMGIEYPEEIKGKLFKLGPFFSVAVGLALIDLE